MDRIKRYHQRQMPQDDRYFEGDSLYGLIHRPIRRVGIYIPGGMPLPSTLIMTGIPAKIAGVSEIAVCTPPNSQGTIHPMILEIAHHLGIAEMYKIGGIQAIGAMAFGIGMEKVDKIFGPGNRFVNEAKRQVYGHVGIDSLAGPSEICVIADHTAPSDWIREDLLSQKEHGADAKAWLLTDSFALAEEFAQEEEIEVRLLPDIRACVQQANMIAPEHLQIVTEDPEQWVDFIQHAGAIYLGQYTPVPAADYFLGSNHVLPTGGCARFSSMLTVRDFCKSSALARLSQADFFAHRALGIHMASEEGLEHHRKSLEIREKEVQST
jgi:histidinol dehydrogenase